MKLETSEDVQEALKLCDSSSSDHTEANKNLAFQCIEKAKWLKDEKLEFAKKVKIDFEGNTFQLNLYEMKENRYKREQREVNMPSLEIRKRENQDA